MNMIDTLREKYSNNSFMLQKLETYLSNLPVLMSVIEDEHIRSCTKRKETDKEKEAFISSFMSEHLYYYIPQSELFIEYNKQDYRVVSEDDITHCVFNATHNKKVQQWKYKINISIIKKIKENMLFNTIPESCTIQYVLKHIGCYFESKNHVKYFLTIMGDTILGKKDNLIYFVDPSYKMLIKNISQYVYMLMNKTLHDVFKHKYYEHKYDLCRNIEGICKGIVDEHFIKTNILNIITIATHYSCRFNSSDGFLEKCQDKTFVNKINLLKNNSSNTILVGAFLQEYTVLCSGTTIMYRDVYYLWRMFLKCNRLPLVVSQNNFKTILQEHGLYDPLTDKCNGIASKYPSYWIQFSKFWKQNVTSNEDNYYEVEEFVSIYNDWCEHPNLHINEDIFKELISLYHPTVVMEDSKYIMNVQCVLWNKHSGIDISMESYKYQEQELDKYKYYCKYITQHHDGKYIASKQYFEKYMNT